MRDAFSRDRIDSGIKLVNASLSAEYGAALEDVVPHHDDAGCNEFCDHVVDAKEIDEHPHEELIEPQACDA